MKTLTELSTLTTYSIRNVKFAVLDNETLKCKCVDIHICVDNSFDYQVNDQIPLEDWVRSMLSDKLILPADCNLMFTDGIPTMKVDSIDLKYILHTLFLILIKLNKDESITFKSIHYEEHD